MDLNRFCIKFFARPDADVDPALFIEIFHEWIRLKKLKGVLIDVADYRHVTNGPGIMLISHETNYAMDQHNGQLGVYAQRKLGEGETHKDRIVDLARAAAQFGSLLEADARVAGKITIEGGKFHYMANDRLHAPNTDETFAEIQADLTSAAAELYPGQTVSVTRLENDPRDRLTAVIETQQQPLEIKALIPVA